VTAQQKQLVIQVRAERLAQHADAGSEPGQPRPGGRRRHAPVPAGDGSRSRAATAATFAVARS
jgi:hypothetical protein